MTYEEYQELKKTIDYHMDRYYNQDSPVISDYAYDQLMEQLKAAEAQHPDWITPDSPSQKIGGTVRRDAGVKVTHHVPMLSIEDVFDPKDVTAWVDKVHELHPDATFSVEQKIDGLSMTLRYRHDPVTGKARLVLAETRGDGLVGEDVTANAMVIPGVLHELDVPFDYLELRGEVYMTHEDFDRYNAEMEKAGKPLSANPRNLAAGTLRQLDPAVTRQRGLRMFIFNVQDGPAEMMESHTRALDFLTDKGVTVVYHQHCRTAEECLRVIDEIGRQRESLPYDIDGAVVKIDEIPYRKDFPEGSKYSSGHIAYKYPPEERVVTMDEILVDVGRTGKLTFTGRFHDTETGRPARLCGTFVSRATLHNIDYITSMRIGVGGEYRLFKSGEIIPKLNGCVKEPPAVFTAPAVCPVCGQPVEREPDTADIRCVNPSCPAQLSRTISYFASQDCMNIMGLGEQLVDALIQTGYLHNYADLYSLKDNRDELIEQGILGKEKNTDKLLANIEGSRQNPPERLLCGLGIRNVGRRTARTLMRHFDSIDALAAAPAEELEAVPDIGGTTAEDIVRFFQNPANQAVLQQLKDAGVNMQVRNPRQAGATTGRGNPGTAAVENGMLSETVLRSQDSPGTGTSSALGNPSDDAAETAADAAPAGSGQELAGLTFVVTGTLPTLGRREVTDLIEDHGGRCTGSVSKKTDYLVAGEAAGSKLTRAQQLGIPVITEAELLAMIS